MFLSSAVLSRRVGSAGDVIPVIASSDDIAEDEPTSEMTRALHRPPFRNRWIALLALLSGITLTASPQTASEVQTPTFRASSTLVLVDVMALDPGSGLPVSKLERRDFRVLDNGNEVPITTFDTGVHYDTRPIALWFVVICGEENRGNQGSGSFLGNETLFRPALDDLDKKDRIGVAHWCDNGDVKLDLPPTDNKDAAITKLGEALAPIPFICPPGMRIGELALQRMFRSIINDAHLKNPQPLPVVVMLHSDYTGQPSKEFNLLIDDFLETSGIVFGIKDAQIPEMHDLRNGEISRIFHYMSEQTGGEYFSVDPQQYGAALREILLRLHFRYELGFKPPVVDGNRHKLEVELAGGARENYKSVRLRYRPEYIPVDPEITQP
jgi:hypothetical protein